MLREDDLDEAKGDRETSARLSFGEDAHDICKACKTYTRMGPQL